MFYISKIMKPDANYPFFYKALRHFIPDEGKKRGGKQKLLCYDAGISQPLLSLILSGDKPGSVGTHMKIAKALGHTYDEFIALGRSLIKTGHPPPAKPPARYTPPEHNLIVHVNTQADKDRLNGIHEHYRGIPLYESGKLYAGISGTEFDPNEQPVSTVVIYRPELQGCSDNLLALRVGGNSMKPTVNKDSIVVVDLNNREFFDRRIYVVSMKEEGQMVAAVKRVRTWQNGFVLVSDNPDYPPEPVALDWNELCVGRVVWQWKNMMES